MRIKSNVFPISAVVVGYNEGHLLQNCLMSIAFCDEIIYTDLGSNDNSVELARQFCDIVYFRSLAPSGEYIQSEIVKLTKNDWILFIDPDEKIDESLSIEIISKFTEIEKSHSIGAIMVPWQFYFKNYKLKGTVWGGSNKKYLIVNKNRFAFNPITHYGRQILPNFETVEIEFNGHSNVLHHYWMSSWITFFKKHFRYLKKEGIDQYEQGIRFTGYLNLIKKPVIEFKRSFFSMKGYKDGLIGLFLSLCWMFYQTYIEVHILLISKRVT